MKKYIYMAAAALMLGVFALPASAQNMGQKRTGDVNDFTGPYVGGTLGYGWGDFDSDTTIGGVTTSDDPDMDGVQGGVMAGYGFQFGTGYEYIWNGFMGLEVGYEWSNADGSAFGADVDKDDNLLITLRPGLSWGDMALGYGIIGYSRARFEVAGEEEWLDGLVLGLGTELYTVGPFKTRLEYMYTNYEDASYSLGGADTVDIDGHENALKLGAVFRF